MVVSTMHDQPDVKSDRPPAGDGLEWHAEPSDSSGARQLQRLAKDPDQDLIVIDSPSFRKQPKFADIHLPIRPGTDALPSQGDDFYHSERRLENKGLSGKSYLRFVTGKISLP